MEPKLTWSSEQHSEDNNNSSHAAFTPKATRRRASIQSQRKDAFQATGTRLYVDVGYVEWVLRSLLMSPSKRSEFPGASELLLGV